MKRKSMLRKLKNLFYADNNSYLDAAAQASAKSAETSAFAPEKQISAEPYAIQDKPQDEFKDYNGNPQDNRIPLQLIEQNEEDNKFLRAVGSKIFEISQEMEDLSKSVNSYGSVVQDFRNMIHERTQEVEKMLSSPWVYAQNQIDSTTWRWMIPGFERRSADKITKRGLESKLCSISKMISDMEIPLDDGSRKAESICLQLNNINILLSRYMERRFGSDTFNAPSEESGQKSGHYNTNEFLKTDLQKNEECYRSQFAYQSGRVASLIGRIEPIQLSLCSIREDMDYTIKKERLGLQSLVEKISSKHEISMMNKEYKLSGRKKRPSLIPAAVTAACMAGLMITYNYNDIAKSVKNIPLVERVERYISGENGEDGQIEQISGSDTGSVAQASRSNDNHLEQVVDGNTFGSGISQGTGSASNQHSRAYYNSSNSRSSSASGSSISKKILSEDYFTFPSELRQLDSTPGQYAIYINKKTQKLTLFRNAEWVKVAEYDVSTGRNFGNKMINGDNKTPETPYTNGNNYKPYFTITSINDSSRWNFENISGAYGPWFMRLDCGTWSGANYSPGGQSPIGIHGVPDLSIYNPDFKDKIGTPASHGCIRMNNGDLSEIRYLVSVGTPVFIIGDDPYHQQIASQNTSLNTPVSYPPANNNHHNSSVRPTPTSSAVSTSHNIPNASMYDPKTANAIPGNTVTIPRIHGVQESNIKYESTTASGNPKPEIPASAGTIAGDTANNAL